MDITNPPTELWTGPWEALTFDNKPTTDYDNRANDIDDTGYTRVIDGRPNYYGTGDAEGRTWVGESPTAPNSSVWFVIVNPMRSVVLNKMNIAVSSSYSFNKAFKINLLCNAGICIPDK